MLALICTVALAYAALRCPHLEALCLRYLDRKCKEDDR